MAGLNKDIDPKFLQSDSYTFALNSIQVSDEDIAMNNITEPGNELCFELPDNHSIIGHVELNDDSVLLFTTNDITSCLYIQNDCKIVKLAEGNLNFSKRNYISALYRLVRECERVVYFTDGVNPYRSINIDRIEDYLNNGLLDFDLVNHFYQPSLPKIEKVDLIENSGSLIPGAYEFAIQIGSSNWSLLTEPIYIYNDNSSNNFENVKGNQNGEFYDFYDGGIKNTFKAIELTLDKEVEKYNLAIIQYLEGIGTVTKVEVIKDLTSKVFLYTGKETSTLLDIDDIRIDNLILSKVNNHNLVQNRLLLANVESPNYNWELLQMKANEITSRYVVNEVNKNITAKEFYLDCRNFMRDEVYAFGIVWEMKDGTRSPVLHIPGRVKDIPINNLNIHPRPDAISLWDSETQTPDWSPEDLEGFNNPERWEVYNTAIKDSTPETGYYSSGEFAYYNNNVDYPDTEYCDPQTQNKTRIYPTGKVRYHKFPDATLEPHNNSSSIFRMGVKFLNIDAGVYSSRVKGYYIVVNSSNSNYQTIVAKGVLANGYTNFESQDVSFSDPFHVHRHSFTSYNFAWNDSNPKSKSPNYHYFTSPDHLMNKQYINGTHYKVEKLESSTSLREGNKLLVMEGNYVNSPSAINRKIVDSVNLGYNSIEAGSPTAPPYGYYTDLDARTVVSDSTSTSIICSKLESLYTDFNIGNSPLKAENVPYVSMKNNSPVMVDLETIIYNITDVGIQNSDTAVTFKGDTFINSFYVTYERLTYSDTLLEEDIAKDNDTIYFFCESRNNIGLRHGGEDCKKVFKKSDSFLTYINRNPLYKVDNTAGCNEFIDINKDYSVSNRGKLFLPMKFEESCLPDCDYSLPNHIYYSEVGNLEDSSDNLKNFRLNNFTIIPKEAGEITNMFNYKDNLYIQTNRSLWAMPINNQSLQSEDVSIYLGKADFLSIPPKRLSEIGFSGINNFLSCLVIEYGVIFVDEYSGKILLFNSSGFKDISEGLTRYLQKNLKLGNSLVVKDDSHKGFQFVYDRFYQRFILTVKKFEPILEPLTDINDFVLGSFVYYKNKYGLWNGTNLNEISYYNENFFINNSFTLSYDLMRGCWSSFHSYLPNYMYNNKDKFYTVLSDSIWEHSHDRNFTNFYGNKYDYIIEIVNNQSSPFITKLNQTIKFIAEVEDYNELTNSWSEVEGEIFDKMWVYNNDQSTGVKTLVNKNNTDHLFTTINFNTQSLIEKEEKYWNINGFRDLSTSSLILDNSWNTIKNDYFIDYLPTNIDTSMSYYDQSRFRDKYLKVRLFYKPIEDYRLKMSLLNVQSFPGGSK